MINAMEELFEMVDVAGVLALFTDCCVDRDSVPKHLHCYDIRHDDESKGIACEIAPSILVKYLGAILTKREISLENGRYYLEEDINYLDYRMYLTVFDSTSEEDLKNMSD